MPRTWSNKDERKYEHIKESAKKRGAPTKRAKEIAARTVNKGRREEGRTRNKRTMGTGKPGKRNTERTRDELYNRAKELGIEGRSKMNKAQLAKAVSERS
jgi:hypothetical protein